MVRTFVAAAALLASGCLDFGGEPHPGISGRVLLEPGLVGPGLVFYEQGHVHEGEFKFFSMMDDDGHFEIDLPRGSGGPWGVHLYFDDYFYLPLEVEVAEDFVTPIDQPDIAWGTMRAGTTWGSSGRQPDDGNLLAMIPDDALADNPTLDNPVVQRVGPGVFQASVDIADPDAVDWDNCWDDQGRSRMICLSNQELLGNAATGIGIQLNSNNPDQSPADKNYPNGNYSATLYVDDDVGLGTDWWFVAADNGCSNSPVTKVRAQ